MTNVNMAGYGQSLGDIIAKQPKKAQTRPEQVAGLEKTTKITNQYLNYSAKSGTVTIYFSGEGFYIIGKDYKNPAFGNPGPVMYPEKALYLNGEKEADAEEIRRYLTLEEQTEAVILATAVTGALKNIQPLYFADDNGIIQKSGPAGAKITVGGNEYIAWDNGEPRLYDDKGFYYFHREKINNKFDGVTYETESKNYLPGARAINFVEKNQMEVRRYFQMSSRGGLRRQRIDAPQAAEKVNDNQTEEKSVGWVEHYKGEAYAFVFRDENNRPYTVSTDPIDKFFGKDPVRWLKEEEVVREKVYHDKKGYYFLDEYPVGTFRRDIKDIRYIYFKK